MLGWAFGYLAMAIVVAVGFAALQGIGGSEPPPVAAAARPQKPAKPDLRPAESDEEPGLEHVIEADPSGHYVIDAMVNGAPVTFLIDTGASEIVLTLDDARRIGIEPRTLAFTQRFATANGEVRAAPVVLREIRVGQFRLLDVEASVNEAPLPLSLLGMSFLEQLGGYEVDRGRLILRW
jgi:aspartyl protease family protein